MSKLLCCLIVFFKTLDACTAFQLSSTDGARLYCRSMEFGFKMNSDLLIVPRNTPFTAAKSGLKWSSKYGFIGMNQSFAKTVVSDGMNEKGVVVGMLYMPGFAKYEKTAKQNKILGPWEVATYLLSTCGDLTDVQKELSQICVAEQVLPGTKDFIIPLHYYITDPSGDVLVVEYVNGKQNVHKNPLRVLTNSPPFDWQMINLGNYTHLSPVNTPPLQLSNYTARPFGQGSGLVGLPGDYTPPSRFVRATLFSQWATQQKTASDTALLGFHLLNTFDIVYGLVRSSKTIDFTEWCLIHDMTNLKTYFRSYASLAIQSIDIKTIDFKTPGYRKISLKKELEVIDETKNIEPLLNPESSEPVLLQ